SGTSSRPARPAAACSAAPCPIRLRPLAGGRMKLRLGLLAAAALLPAAARADDKPYSVAYYYTVKWGFHEEFERLFLKNHYPILKAEQEQGRIRSVHAFRPTFHGDGRADWSMVVLITYASWAALGTAADEEAIARRIF